MEELLSFIEESGGNGRADAGGKAGRRRKGGKGARKDAAGAGPAAAPDEPGGAQAEADGSLAKQQDRAAGTPGGTPRQQQGKTMSYHAALRELQESLRAASPRMPDPAALEVSSSSTAPAQQLLNGHGNGTAAAEVPQQPADGGVKPAVPGNALEDDEDSSEEGGGGRGMLMAARMSQRWRRR